MSSRWAFYISEIFWNWDILSIHEIVLYPFVTWKCWNTFPTQFKLNLSLLLISLVGFKLSKGKLYQTVATLGEQWYLSFDIKPGTKRISTLSSIVHATVKENNNRVGARIPAVFFLANSRKLRICTGLGNNKNHCYNSPKNLPTNRYTNVQVRQNWDTKANVYKYIINIDGQEKRSVTNTRAQTFKFVKLWAADKWHSPADAHIRNLVYKNLPNGKLKTTWLSELMFLTINVSGTF